MSRIQKVFGRQVFDSRGYPTVEVEVTTADGVFRASVPSGAAPAVAGASVELRDTANPAYLGRSVLTAVEKVNTEIHEALLDSDPSDQEGLDQILKDLDGTEDKSRLGANALLGVSMACCRAGAGKKGIPLYKHINGLAGDPAICIPVPAFNVLNGGKHAFNRLAVQEVLVVPIGAGSFVEAMRIGTEVYHTLKRLVKKKYGYTAVGDEGGFAPPIGDIQDALRIVSEAIAVAGYKDVASIAIDVAASEFYKQSNGTYDFDFKKPHNDGSKCVGTEALSTMYKHLCVDFDIVSIEDPFYHEDLPSFSRITKELGEVVQIIGDDLLISNPARIDGVAAARGANALLLKMSQCGTVSETIEAFHRARAASWGVAVSHRSGDTEDTFIADLATGLGAGQIKAGAPARSERVAKYNQLLRIEEELEDRSAFAGDYWREPWALENAQAGI